MSIRYEINPDIKVRIVRYSGYVSGEDMKGFADRMLQLTLEEFTYAGILIFEDDVDLSGIAADDLLDLADAFSEAAERAGGVGHLNVAAVSDKNSVMNELRLWREFMSQEKSFVYDLSTYPTIEAACQHLELDDQACETVKSGQGFKSA